MNSHHQLFQVRSRSKPTVANKEHAAIGEISRFVRVSEEDDGITTHTVGLFGPATPP